MADAALAGPVDAIAASSVWDETAQALHEMLCEPERTWLKIEIDGATQIFVDSRLRAFEWPGGVDALPAAPRQVRIQSTLVPYDAHPPFQLPGASLDTLLWTVGCNAFAGQAAPWLASGDRYRLRRWPNLTTLPHTVDHMRLTAQIGTRLQSVDEMAAATGIDRAVVQSAINAFSLMGILQSAAATGTAATVTAPAASGTGLFARLLRRLGL